MTEPKPPRYRTGTLWGVLGLFLTIGTIAAAFFVYGVTDLLSTGRVYPDVPIAVAGAVLATFFMLMITGILYRVDRLRGVPHRTVRMFD
ncbi:MAG: hypothetical protein L3K19_07765 [Thermoplasmata archaeon]|nr:hypothetical protein [Thermoplasmata archaeon]